MKLNSTLVFTLILLSLMFGAGLVSAAWGIVVGRDALKGITQPDTRPTNNAANHPPASNREGLAILREEEIIASAKARMNGASGENKSKASPESENQAVAKKTAKVTTAPSQVQFPLVSQSHGVTLEVTSVSRQGDSFVLKVSLRNRGKQSVQFLYSSFLSMKDDKGRMLTVDAQGLPAELDTSGETFSGTISVPVSLLDNVEKVSLSLTDYPDQQLQLQLSNIPVSK
jgi:hypothetical protein